MKHLNILWLLLLLITSDFAIAWGYGGAEGKNRLGQTVGFTSEEIHQIWIHDPKYGKDHFMTYPMSSECPAIVQWLDEEPQKGLLIRCPANGHSPLAGATYTKLKSRRIKNFCDAPAIIFKCVAGCERKKVPLIIVEQPWEC